MSNRERILAALERPEFALIAAAATERYDERLEDDEAVADWPEYDLADAFDDVADMALYNRKCPDSRKLRRMADDVLIAAGFYRDCTDDVRSGRIVASGGKRYDVKRGGRMYACEMGWSEWIER